MASQNDRDRDLEREIAQHIELEAEERAADGLSEEDARVAARKAFGNPTLVREDVRQIWKPRWLQEAGQDLRYAWRLSRRMPSFTLGVILIFALGIGATTTVFGALNAVVLAPLPFPQPEELVRVNQANQERGVDAFSVSLPLYRDWKARNTVFSGMAASRWGTTTVLGLGDPQRLRTEWVSHDYLDLFAVRPVIGRAFAESDDVVDGGRVVMVSEGLWRQAFAGDQSVLDRTLTVDGRTHTIIGVVPADSLTPDPFILVPLVPFTEDRRDFSDLDVFARLKPGVSAAQASAAMANVADRLAEEYPEAHGGWSVRVTPLSDAILGSQMPGMFYFVLAAVGLLLLVACANLSSLLLVRASARGREMAIRTAIGGGRGRLVRQLITESLLLSLVGGTVGLFCALAGMRALRSLLGTDLPRGAEISLSPEVAAFAVLVSVVAGVLAGLAPARQTSRLDVTDGLRNDGRSATAGPQRMRHGLVTAQVALSLVLLVAAGLTMRSLRHLTSVDLGFSPSQIVTAQMAPGSQPEAFFIDLLARLRGMPGVEAAAAVSSAPMTPMNFSLNVFPVGSARIPSTTSVQCDWRIVSDGYFDVMETPVLAGRDFSAQDDEQAPKVVMVNQALARQVWGDDDPIGRQLDLGGGGGTPATVVGLVRDMRHHEPGRAPTPTFYVPAASGVWGGMTVMIRTASAAADLIPRVRSEVAQLDPTLPVSDVRTMTSLVRRALAPQELLTVVTSVFGGFALILATLGLYGTMAFSARNRAREAAIRLALGAPRAHVIALIVGRGGRLAAVGLLLGLVVAWPAAQLMRGVIDGVEPADPVTLAVASAVLALATLVACYLPARRLARTSPLQALRGE